jgi:hypothetical protein
MSATSDHESLAGASIDRIAVRRLLGLEAKPRYETDAVSGMPIFVRPVR